MGLYCLMGRRRIGKTKLLFKATEGIPMLYFFVARKSEPMLYTNLGAIGIEKEKTKSI